MLIDRPSQPGLVAVQAPTESEGLTGGFVTLG
jgi:hypothetical protein